MRVFSLKHLLLVSIALNVSLILRVMNITEKDMVLHAVSRDSPFNAYSSLSSSSVHIEAADGGDRVINLDQ